MTAPPPATIPAAGLALRPEGDCRYDVVALGEVMLRLDPGEGRVRSARSFRVWEGGGEYNVARGLRRTFGRRAALVTALVDNEVGHLIEDLVLTGGVDTALVRWAPFDGVGRGLRNGLNFTERGFGVRGATGTSDRGHTAVAALRPGDVDWDHLFGEVGVRWLHTGGIFAALGPHTAAVVHEAAEAAHRHGTVVSYDVNYRPSLWGPVGGIERAHEVNGEIARHVDVLFGDVGALAAPAGDTPGDHGVLCAEVAARSATLRVIATTLRTVRSATVNDWGALAWTAATGSVRATQRDRLDVLDRVGSGDAFAAGLIGGLLEGRDLPTALEWGAAHGALAMTTPGDSSMATREEVLRLAAGGSAGVLR